MDADISHMRENQCIINPELLSQLQARSTIEQAFNSLRRMGTELLSTSDYLQWVDSYIRQTQEQLRAEVPAGAHANKAVRAMLDKQRILMQQILKAPPLPPPCTSVPILNMAIWAGNISVKACMASVKISKLMRSTEGLPSRILEPFETYHRFIETTFAQLSTETAPARVRAIETSVRLAESQLVGISEGIMAIGHGSEITERSSQQRVLSAPFRQKEELLSARELANDEHLLVIVTLSPTAVLERDSRRVLDQIVKCNTVSKTLGKIEIFAPTNRLLQIFSDFSWLEVKDDRSFADFVDCLFIALYESAGSASLRFLKDNGGPLGRSECGAVWIVKRFRQLVRHDLDHGGSCDERKKWADVSRDLFSLGLLSYPKTSFDFDKLRQALLASVNQFLECLIAKLER